MPAQPGATGPSQIQATSTQAAGTRPVLTQPGGGRDGMARGVGGRRHARGRGNSRRPRRPGRWGTWQGGLGVCIIVAGAAVGAGGTIATRHAPGALLQLSVVAGTVAAGFAIRPRSGWMIIPVPVLSYLVAALLSGFVFERPAGLSMTALAIAAAQWIADGFFAMALGTVLAAVITAGRWILWRRGDRDKHAGGDQVWPPPARTGRRPRGAWEASAEPRYPGAADATKAPGDPGARGTGSRPGPGPYNFSSGA